MVTSTIVEMAIEGWYAPLSCQQCDTSSYEYAFTHFSSTSWGLPTILTVNTATRPSMAFFPSGATLVISTSLFTFTTTTTLALTWRNDWYHLIISAWSMGDAKEWRTTCIIEQSRNIGHIRLICVVSETGLTRESWLIGNGLKRDHGSRHVPYNLVSSSIIPNYQHYPTIHEMTGPTHQWRYHALAQLPSLH